MTTIPKYTFTTTPEDRIRLAEIVIKMKKAQMDVNFIDECAELARYDEGICDLMILWESAKTIKDRDETISDLVNMLNYEEEMNYTKDQLIEHPDVRVHDISNFVQVTREEGIYDDWSVGLYHNTGGCILSSGHLTEEEAEDYAKMVKYHLNNFLSPRRSEI